MAKDTLYDGGAVPNGPDSVEIGQTGLRGATPREGWLHQEFLAKLRGRTGMKMYREMAENDPLIGAVLNSFQMLIQSLTWAWTPADQSQEAVAVKGMFEEMFFKGMRNTFGESIEESLSMLPYGFSLLEVVLRKARPEEMGDVYVDKLAPRAADSVWRWYFDKTGDVQGFAQQLQYDGTVDIPISKMLHFKTRSALGNPEGKSLLRNAYTSYVKKNLVEDAEGKIVNRAAGVVVMRIPQKYLDPRASAEDKKIRYMYENIGKSVARDRQGFLLLSSRKVDGEYEYDFEYKTTDAGSRPVDHSAIVDRHDQRIAMSMMADFIMLGHGKVGSYALSQNKTDLFSLACGAVADNIAEPFNRKLAPKLMKLNGLDLSLQPTLTHSDMKMQDPEVMANVVSLLATAGFPDVITPEVGAEILRVAKLPVSSSTSEAG